MFLILFVTTGIGNGSTYRMIPSIFREENLRKVRGKGEAARTAGHENGKHREVARRLDSSARSALAAAT